jgi:hypothetical protein
LTTLRGQVAVPQWAPCRSCRPLRRACPAKVAASLRQRVSHALLREIFRSTGSASRRLRPSSLFFGTEFITRCLPELSGARRRGKGGQLKDFPPGQEVMRTASEGKVSEITYLWPRLGSIRPLERHTFYTKVGDQICGVGYYKMNEPESVIKMNSSVRS